MVENYFGLLSDWLLATFEKVWEEPRSRPDACVALLCSRSAFFDDRAILGFSFATKIRLTRKTLSRVLNDRLQQTSRISIWVDSFDRVANFYTCPGIDTAINICLLYTSPSPRDGLLSRMPSSA